MQYDYAKNKEEKPEPMKAVTEGTVPPWLQGTLVRVGPGLFSVGETSYDHWFDGMSLLHSFTIKDGNVFYRSRFLRGDTYKANMEAKRIVISEMGTMAYPDSSKSIFSKFITFLNHTVPDFTDNCGNNIIRYGNNFYATSETNYIRKIDPITLETHDKVDYMKYLPVNIVTSHPHYDKEGNAYNMGTSIADKAKTKYILFKVPAEKEASPRTSPVLKNTEIICTLPCRSVFSPSYYHSFGMTENFFIFIEQPLKLDILKMATAYMRGVNWASCIKYLPDDNTLIQLIDRRTKKVVHKFYTDAMVVHHLVNAYEEDGHAVLDVIAYCDNSLYDMFYLSKMKEGPESPGSKDTDFTSKYKRLVLPLSDKGAGTGENIVKLKHTTATAVKEKDGKILCHPEILCEGTEVPRINYDLNGKKHRFVYMTCVGSAIATKIGKFDAETKKMIEWSEESCLPSEPVFIPKPNAVEEDDGVVLTSVINLNPGKSFLLVLDAKSFKEVARSYVNTDLHMDMHGYFIPECS